MENKGAICLVCLRECKLRRVALNDTIPLVGDKELVSYAEAYMRCTQIDIKGFEGLPELLCKSCSCDLWCAYDFRTKAKESFEKLSKEIGLRKPKEEDEEGAAAQYEISWVDNNVAVPDINTDMDLLETCSDEEMADPIDPLENDKTKNVKKQKLDSLNKRQRPSASKSCDKPLNQNTRSHKDQRSLNVGTTLTSIQPMTDIKAHSPTPKTSASVSAANTTRTDKDDINFTDDFDMVENVQSDTEFSNHSFSFDDNDAFTEQKDNTNEQKDNTNDQKDNTNDQKDNTNEQKDNTNEQKDNTNEQKDNTNEQKDNTNEQKDNTNEQKDNTNEQKDNTNESWIMDPTIPPETILFPKGQKKCSICEHSYFTTIGLNVHMEVHQVKENYSRIRELSNKQTIRHRTETKVVDTDLNSDTENKQHSFTDFENYADSVNVFERYAENVADFARSAENLTNFERSTENITNYETYAENEEIKVQKVGRKKSKARKPKEPQSTPPEPKVAKPRKKQIWTCKVCSKTVNTKHSFILHMRIHTGERPYGCKICGDAFICKATLKAHERRHTGERPYACDLCGKRFIQHSSMTTHKKLNHAERTLQCPHCIKKYARKLDLVAHLNSHTGYKAYKCYLCPSSFVRNAVLEEHLRNVHPNEADEDEDSSKQDGSKKPYSTKNRPYMCDLCPSRFTQKWVLSKHINTAHRQDSNAANTSEISSKEST